MRRKKERNVNVVVRVRPEMPFERLKAKNLKVQTTEKEVIIKQIEKRISISSVYKKFNFDRVYDEISEQKDIYDKTVVPIIKEVIEGFNCTIFAYGQTGTGKTFTIEGQFDYKLASSSRELSRNAGIIPRAVKCILESLKARKIEHSIRVSFLELYNEELIDLLSENEKPLRIYEDSKNAISVHNLEQLIVQNEADIFAVLKKGVDKRHTAETKINRHSSRSHCVFTLTIHMKQANARGEDIVKIGTLNLVDLAGSESVGRSGAQKARAKEAGMINTSLLTLGRVVTALVDRLPYVPYRDSKLTRLLQESLGGRAKTVIIATISPFADEETMGTLEYANRAKDVLNKPEVNQLLTHGKYLQEVTRKLLDLQHENECLRKEHGIFLPEEKFNRMVCENRSLGEKAARLQSGLRSKTEENEQLAERLHARREELRRLAEERCRLNRDLEDVRRDLEAAKQRLEKSHAEEQRKGFLLAVFKRNEQSLFREARRLGQRFERLQAENARLCDKIEKRDTLDRVNRQSLAEVERALAERNAEAARRRDVFLEENAKSLEVIREEIGSFGEESAKKLTEMETAVKTLCADGKTEREKLLRKWVETDQRQQAAAKAFGARSAEFSRQMLSGESATSLAAFSAGSNEKVNAIKTEFQSLRKKSDEFLSFCLGEVSLQEERQCSFQKETAALSEALRSAVLCEFKEKMTKTIKTTESSSEAKLLDFERESREELAAIVEGFRSSVDAHFAQRQKSVKSIGAHLREQFALISGVNENLCRGVEANLRRRGDLSEKFAESGAERLTARKRKYGGFKNLLGASAESMDAKAKVLLEETEKNYGDLAKRVDENNAGSLAFLKNLERISVEHKQSLEKTLQNDQKLTDFKRAFSGWTEADASGAFAEKVTRLVSAHSARGDSQADLAAELAREAKEHFGDFLKRKLYTYEPTGQTPKRSKTTTLRKLQRVNEEAALHSFEKENREKLLSAAEKKGDEEEIKKDAFLLCAISAFCT